MKILMLLLVIPLLTNVNMTPSFAQDPEASQVGTDGAQLDSLATRVRVLERRVGRLSSEIENKASTAFILFLYGIFCALWAQNTGRGPWVWFFLGALFNVVTVLFLLSKNAEDRRALAEET